MKPKYTHKTTGRSPLALVITGFIVTLALVLLGASWSTAFGGTVPDANSAPSNLQANGVSTTQINLIFTDNSSDEAGFKVERKTGLHGTWAEIGTIPANGGPNGSVQCGGTIPCNGYGTIGYQDTNGLQPGTLYFYRIRAYESGSLFSPYSNEGNAYTQSSRVVTKSIDDGTPGSFSYELSQVDANNKVITFKPGVYGITIPAGGTIPTIPDGTSIGGTCDTASDTGPVIIIDARNASAASKAAGLNLSGGGTFYGIQILGTKIKASTGGNMVYCDKVIM